MRLLFPRARQLEIRKLPSQCPRALARHAQPQVIRARSSRIQSRPAHGRRAISVSKVLFVAAANWARRRLGFGPSKTCLPFAHELLWVIRPEPVFFLVAIEILLKSLVALMLHGQIPGKDVVEGRNVS